MMVITLGSLALGAALILGLAFALERSGIASSGPGVIGVPFIAPDLTRRPRGVQEDDLPRFVFRDLPWAPPTRTPAASGRLTGALSPA